MNKSKLDPKKEIPADLVAVTPIEDVIKNEIQKFDIKEKDIDTAVEAYRTLKIVGIDDKDGYEAVSQARVVFRNMRTAIEKRRKELKEDSLKIGRAIDAEAARLTSKFVDTEKLLAGYIEEIDSEKERIKREEKERIEREKRARIESRVSSLRSIGFTWDGGAFYDFDGDNPITTVQIDEMIDDDFNAFVFKHKARYNEWVIAEEKRKAEEARIKAEEDAKRKAENERIAKERAELEVLAKARRLEEEQLAKQQAEVERQRKELKEERKKSKPLIKEMESLAETRQDDRVKITADLTNFPPEAAITEEPIFRIDWIADLKDRLRQAESTTRQTINDPDLQKIFNNTNILIKKTQTYFDTEVEKWRAKQK